MAGLSEEQVSTFYERVVPQPAGSMRDAVSLTDDRRLDVSDTIVCTAFPAAEYRPHAEQGMPFLAGALQHRRLELVDLPTAHWPMWSRPADLVEIIARAASGGRLRKNRLPGRCERTRDDSGQKSSPPALDLPVFTGTRRSLSATWSSTPWRSRGGSRPRDGRYPVRSLAQALEGHRTGSNRPLGILSRPGKGPASTRLTAGDQGTRVWTHAC